jgi:hypothetical protein
MSIEYIERKLRWVGLEYLAAFSLACPSHLEVKETSLMRCLMSGMWRQSGAGLGNMLLAVHFDAFLYLVHD